jgi:hypothetical protein
VGGEMSNQIILFLIAIILLGCATNYQKQGFTGGFSETRLAENVFQVNFKGNGFTDFERSTDFTLLRSAELALENGYQYFSIIDRNSWVQQGTYTTPTHTTTTLNTNTTGTYTRSGNTGNLNANTYGTAITRTTGGQTFLISKPRTSNTIFCYSERPQDMIDVFDATFILQSIKEKYGIE